MSTRNMFMKYLCQILAQDLQNKNLCHDPRFVSWKPTPHYKSPISQDIGWQYSLYSLEQRKYQPTGVESPPRPCFFKKKFLWEPDNTRVFLKSKYTSTGQSDYAFWRTLSKLLKCIHEAPTLWSLRGGRGASTIFEGYMALWFLNRQDLPNEPVLSQGKWHSKGAGLWTKMIEIEEA